MLLRPVVVGMAAVALGVGGSMLVAVMIVVFGIGIEAYPSHWNWNHPGALVGLFIGFEAVALRYWSLKRKHSAQLECPECERTTDRLFANYCHNCGANLGQ